MLAVAIVVLVGLYLALFLGPAQSPKLGLDLRGGTQVILTAKPLHGKKVTQGALNQAVNIIRQRVDAAGVGGASISTQGNNDIVVSAPGANRSQLSALDQTAVLNFRQVLQAGAGAPQPTPSVSTSSQPSVSTTLTPKASPTASKTSSKDQVPAALRATPAPSTTPAPTASAASSTAPSTAPSASSTSSSSGSNAVQPLPGSQGPTLASVQSAFAALDCTKTPNPTQGLDNPKNYIIACEPGLQAKELLAPAALTGSEISSAAATVDPQTNQWLVQLNFNHKGSGEWFNLTKKAYEAGTDFTSGACGPPSGCNNIAIVLDGVVQSAPASQQNGIAGGQTQITGSFSQKQASTLANVLKFGALPLKLIKQSEDTVSPTLGSSQLRGGLIAGAIGLALVILYSLLYYRALGLVTIASLAMSGAILYAVTTLLGHSSLGYTLSLPGIAGFIVAVGITADSFVVYFERIRDEVREGKRLRSAVERGWPRARRTIISADAVSLLAAVVLYLVSIGDVRGFAFTLGLSTLSDLFIVFFFTKPLLSLIARNRAFDSGKAWTGIGRARTGAVLEPREA
jgi:preprotein translocase subunit SecD